MIPFREITYSDRTLVQSFTLQSECRNCDLNFMNLMSWRFLYGTELAVYDDKLLFRFHTDGHLAYLPPVGQGDMAAAVRAMHDDSLSQGYPFLMLGVCENMLAHLHEVLPGFFHVSHDRSYTDYIYSRKSLATLAGKKLQPKRNHANRFERTYPDYEYRELTPDLVPECWRLEEEWARNREEATARLGYDDEQHSMRRVFKHWDELGARGAVILIDGKVVAFTFGGPVNYDTFDVCCEKADTSYEGSFAIINREFVRHLPEQYTLINREEDLGIEGLRRAKESYQPLQLLHKYTLITK